MQYYDTENAATAVLLVVCTTATPYGVFHEAQQHFGIGVTLTLATETALFVYVNFNRYMEVKVIFGQRDTYV